MPTGNEHSDRLMKVLVVCVIVLTLMIVMINSAMIIMMRVTPSDVLAEVKSLERQIQLRESEVSTLYQTLLLTDSAIVEIDKMGNITKWNATAEKFFGYQSSQMVGLPIETIMPKEQREQHSAGFQMAIESGKPTHASTDCEVLSSQGDLVPVSVNFWVAAGGPAVAIITPRRMKP